MAINYKKKYLNHFGHGEQSYIGCELCGSPSSDIHHINFRSLGGGNDISNLMAICRFHHDLAHAGGLSQEYLQEVHNAFLKQ